MQSIVVNGVLAFINGTNFEAVNVPLNDGANLITATLFDSTMLTNVSSINITTTSNSDGSLNSPVQLQATPVAGFNPAAVVFQPQTNIPGVTQVVYDFVGSDIPAFTNNSLNAYTYTYTTNGQYYPVVTVQTPVARFSSIGGWNSSVANSTNPPVRVTVLPPPTALTVTNINGLASVINIANPVDLKWTATSNLYVLSGAPDRSRRAPSRMHGQIGEACLKASRVQSDTGVIVIVARNGPRRRCVATGSGFCACCATRTEADTARARLLSPAPCLALEWAIGRPSQTSFLGSTSGSAQMPLPTIFLGAAGAGALLCQPAHLSRTREA